MDLSVESWLGYFLSRVSDQVLAISLFRLLLLTGMTLMMVTMANFNEILIVLLDDRDLAKPVILYLVLLMFLFKFPDVFSKLPVNYIYCAIMTVAEASFWMIMNILVIFNFPIFAMFLQLVFIGVFFVLTTYTAPLLNL